MTGIHPQSGPHTIPLDQLSKFLQLIKRIEDNRVRVPYNRIHVFFIVGRTEGMNFLPEFLIAESCLMQSARTSSVNIPGHHREGSKRGIGFQGMKDFAAGSVLYISHDLHVFFYEGLVQE